MIRNEFCKQTAGEVLHTFFLSDHMFKEMLKFMRYDGLIAKDELPAPKNTENEAVEVVEVNLNLASLLNTLHLKLQKKIGGTVWNYENFSKTYMVRREN